MRSEVNHAGTNIRDRSNHYPGMIRRVNRAYMLCLMFTVGDSMRGVQDKNKTSHHNLGASGPFIKPKGGGAFG